jgi:hypothetical protein
VEAPAGQASRILVAMPLSRRSFLGAMAAAPLVPIALSARQRAQPVASRLIVVSIDGVRTQEIFGGLDRDLLQAVIGEPKVEDHAAFKAWWRPTPEERRRTVMPFLWDDLLVRHGSIVGNQARGSVMRLANRHRFSYPGYSELMLGVAYDDEIASNDNRRYPHETVLQFLRRSLRVRHEQVALFGSWGQFQSIAASRDGDVFTNAGYQDYQSADAAMRALSHAQHETAPAWNGSRYDAFTFRFAMDHLARHRPLVQWVALNDTDDWAHQRNYVRVVEHLHRVDGWLRELWTWLQSQNDYRGRTALVIVTDHGRGNGATDWNGHGADIVGAENVWAAFAVPGWQRRGEWTSHAPVSQSQIAATLVTIMGFDWRAASPKAGEALSGSAA